jgi:NadR type nicotinamide-nucleotide adenylyltransferase
MIKVAIVGPEASGKTALANQLAEHFNTSFAPEFAREYLLKNGLNYKKNDLIEIAKGQIKAEEDASQKSNKIVFFDTNLLVIKIWSEYKYLSCDKQILNWHKNRDYDLHLLLRPDLVYEEDPLRENPGLDQREELFEIYKYQLIKEGEPFAVIEGRGKDRFKNALNTLQSKFSL